MLLKSSQQLIRFIENVIPRPYRFGIFFVAILSCFELKRKIVFADYSLPDFGEGTKKPPRHRNESGRGGLIFTQKLNF